MTEIEVKGTDVQADATTGSTVHSGSHVADPHVDLDRAQRLANAVHSKIMANSDYVARSEKKLTIEVYPKGHGFDIKLKLTI